MLPKMFLIYSPLNNCKQGQLTPTIMNFWSIAVLYLFNFQEKQLKIPQSQWAEREIAGREAVQTLMCIFSGPANQEVLESKNIYVYAQVIDSHWN